MTSGSGQDADRRGLGARQLQQRARPRARRYQTSPARATSPSAHCRTLTTNHQTGRRARSDVPMTARSSASAQAHRRRRRRRPRPPGPSAPADRRTPRARSCGWRGRRPSAVDDGRRRDRRPPEHGAHVGALDLDGDRRPATGAVEAQAAQRVGGEALGPAGEEPAGVRERLAAVVARDGVEHDRHPGRPGQRGVQLVAAAPRPTSASESATPARSLGGGADDVRPSVADAKLHVPQRHSPDAACSSAMPSTGHGRRRAAPSRRPRRRRRAASRGRR